MKMFNNYLKFMLAAMLLVSGFLLTSCGDDDDGGGVIPDGPNVVDVAVANGYNTLAAALTEAGLVDDLEAAGPFTVFAPTDEAFADAGITASNVGDVENLEAILMYHVISGSITSSELSNGKVKTLNGASVTIDADELMVDEAKIVSPYDVEASNGIIHTINAVLMPPPPTIVATAKANSNLSILADALSNYPDLVSMLDGEGKYTVFAPTNAAFESLLNVIGQDDIDDVPENVIKRILQYHVIANSALMSGDLTDGQMAATALSEEDMITVSIDGDVMINDATVTSADIEASNGVVHVINGVLVPKMEMSIVNTIVEPAYFNEDFSILTAAVVKADLLGTLTKSGDNYTLFAPDNDAFEAAGITSLDGLSGEDLAPILQYHVLNSEVFAEDLPSTANMFATPISTLNGEFYLTNNVNGVFINGNSKVTLAASADGPMDYDNGTVHIINRALMPATMDVIGIANAAGFTDLAAALTEAGLVGKLQTDGPFTVFAPTNEAIQALYTALNVSGPEEVDDEILNTVLLYHVIGARVFSSDLTDGFQATTLAEESSFSIDINGGTVTLQDNDPDFADPVVTSTDRLGTNGVVHVIDAVLLPTDL
ncbi:fasciclin domain-containing protein [Fulvivirga sediminis]|uniref:Fasciclin domain-containing protein n=1 Tax=Fulvivirga sediminis TaxID=2803949 RepID=A0A937F4H0_9BACT|nr:fasciclin domain-containing protein [Fulvivirga sediminis]MBL3654524.1 fasciclin domain-containing protein [Fulvivirga sediminis]